MARLAPMLPMSPPVPVRSSSLSSTSIVRSNSSTSMSSTPATSNADSSIVPPSMNVEDLFKAAAEAGANAALTGEEGRRVIRARRSLLASYNENVLSGTAKRKSMDRASRRTASGETLLPEDESHDIDGGLLGESIKVLDLDWDIGSNTASAAPAPSNGTMETKVAANDTDKGSRRRSTRLELVSKAKDVFEGVRSGAASAASTLGKRTREAMETGAKNAKEAMSSLMDRRTSLRPRGQEKAIAEQPEEPPKKKTRFSDASTIKDTTKTSPVATKTAPPPMSPRPKRKLWLTHGLYVGQDPDFKPHLTEKTNKAKILKRKSTTEKKPFLPLPMFAGKRLIESERHFRLPFDVFSPPLTRQPKPEEWKKVTKNVFVGEAAEFWKKGKMKEVSKCVCTTEFGCDEDCQNRHMFYECDEYNCAVGPKLCTNRSFENLRARVKMGGKYNIGVEVFKTEDRGWGVRSNRTFEPNQIILEYTGEIITQEECERRMKKEYKKNECFYLMVFDQNMIIDATRGSIARFVNHSCEPNCKMVKWTVAGKPRMALFAGENGVMTGEELCYDYNFDPYSSKNVQECRCGSVKCRGVLGPKPKEEKKIVQPLVKHAKRKFKQFRAGNKGTKAIPNPPKKRKLAVPKSLKKTVSTTQAKAAIPAKVTPQTPKKSIGRQTAVALGLRGQKKPMKTYKVPKKTSTTSLSAIRQKPMPKKTIKRVLKTAVTKTSMAKEEALQSIRVSPRKKVKTFKAAELTPPVRKVQVPKRQSSLKGTAAASLRRGVVRTVKGSRAGVAAMGAKGNRTIRVVG